MAEREKLSFDRGWRFHLGDLPHKPVMNYMATYHAASAESGRGGAAAAYDDCDWQTVDLPHDMLIGIKPEQGENEDHGYVRRENGWYRNYFYLDENRKDDRFSLRFDGVATACIVWVNGVELWRNFTAGVSFDVDFTDVARFGDEVNVVSVYIDNSSFEGWYYEGGGLYRHVWLIVRDRLSVKDFGVFAKPVCKADGDWDVIAQTKVVNDCGLSRDGIVVSTVLDAGGVTVCTDRQPFSVDTYDETSVEQILHVKNPALWSLDKPNLYTLQTSVESGGSVIDKTKTTFGFRTVTFDPDRGLLLNGEITRIKGMCVHQEHGGLGVALPDGVIEYRVRRLQEMGCNAIRTAHNPPAPELLDICDRLGMLVMEENRWLDSSQEGMKQLQSMIVRDRNHPSVIMWSMFNEEGAMEFDFGPKIMNAMRAHAHRLDDSRPVTYAQNTGLLKPGVARTGDLIGVNYNNHWYPELHKMYPDMTLFGAETIGYINGRLNEVMDTWHNVLMHDYHAGIFAWTGFDYRGEAHWPDVYFRFGAMDPSGEAKDGYHLYRAYWRSEPVIHIATTWKNGAKKGSPQEIRVYANGVAAEVFVDGASLGRQIVDPAYQTKWDFAYRDCVLEAVSYDKDGNEIARCRLDCPQTPASISIDEVARFKDVVILEARAIDKNGAFCDRANGELLRFEFDGPARVLCVGDGDVRDYDVWGSYCCRLRRGHCQVVLSSSNAGITAVTVDTQNLGRARISVETSSGDTPKVEPALNLFISSWLRSPVYESVTDPTRMLFEDSSGWEKFYTSDGAATHAVLTDGCVGFRADTAIPEGAAGIVFEQNEYEFCLRVTSHGVEDYLTEIRDRGDVSVGLPPRFKPGMAVSLHVGMSPKQGRDQLGICQNVRWSVTQRGGVVK